MDDSVINSNMSEELQPGEVQYDDICISHSSLSPSLENFEKINEDNDDVVGSDSDTECTSVNYDGGPQTSSIPVAKDTVILSQEIEEERTSSQVC